VAGGLAAKNLSSGISAENERARLAEKRRVYVCCVTAFGGLIHSMAKQHALGDDGDDALETALSIERGAALTTLLNTLGELMLIAPEDVMHLADRAGRVLTEYSGSDPDAARFREVREQLLMAMRADLGEPVPVGMADAVQV